MMIKTTTAALLFTAVTMVAAGSYAADKRPNAPQADLDATVAFDSATFTMGTSTDKEVGRYGDSWFVNQQPAHQVSLDAFRLDAFEVTVADFAMFLTYSAGDAHWQPTQPIEKVDNGYLAVEGAADEPIRSVTWKAADHYCKWAGKRLPTEAQWEYAAAGAQKRSYPWGEKGGGCEVSNFFKTRSSCENGPVDVGSYEAGKTPDGIYDMGGNVAEWTADWYARYPDDGAAQTNPTGPDTGTMRVVRGGGHMSSGRWRRTDARWGADPDRHSRNIGFRCAYNSTAPADSAMRGDLSAPADQGRQPTDRPLVPPAPTPTVVAEDLSFPGSVVMAAGRWFVLARGSASVVSIDPLDRTVAHVTDQLDDPVNMATDGMSLFVADKGSEKIVKIDPATGTATTLADDQPNPRRVAANTDGVAWYSGPKLQYYSTSKQQVDELIADVPGPISLTLDGTTIYYTTDGGGEPAATMLKSIDAAANDPAANVILDNDTFQDVLYPRQVQMEPSGYLWFVMRYRGFPHNGFICRIDLQASTGPCPTYTPRPTSTRMAVVGSTAYVPTRSTIISFDKAHDQTFYSLTPWTQAGGVLATDEYVVWSDKTNGRVYYQEAP